MTLLVPSPLNYRDLAPSSYQRNNNIIFYQIRYSSLYLFVRTYPFIQYSGFPSKIKFMCFILKKLVHTQASII